LAKQTNKETKKGRNTYEGAKKEREREKCLG